MIRILLLVIAVMVVSGCTKNADPLYDIYDSVWFPVIVESNEDASTIGLYALKFHKDGNMETYILGTNYKESKEYGRNDNEITFLIDSDSVKLKFSRSGNRLTITFDSLNTVFYSNQIGSSRDDLTKQLDQVLVDRSWEWDSDLVEFHNSLDKSIIKPELHKELKDFSIHFKNEEYYHLSENAAWGTSYFNGVNFLCLGNGLGDIKNQYFIIESVMDTLITGVQFDELGKKKTVKFTALPTKKVTPLIIGKWNMESYKEVANEFLNITLLTYSNEKGISMTDLKRGNLSITFNKDSTYKYSSNEEVVSVGKWQLDKSGSILKLTAVYNEVVETDYRASYISIISLTKNEFVFHKEENIILEEGEFERREFIETFRRY